MANTETTQTDYNMQAFPSSVFDLGMTLLDYFAGQVVMKTGTYKPKGFYHWCRWFLGMSYQGCSTAHVTNAKNAYAQAAAMLEERKKYIKS